MTRISDEIAAAVSMCDREPIHIPGSIQPHGMLLALDEPDYRVEQASENCRSILAADSAGVCGRRVEEIFGDQNGSRLRAALENAALKLENNPEYLMSLQIGDQPYQALAHRREGILILELESGASTGSIGFSQVYGLVTRFMSDLAPAVSTEEMSSVAAREVRRITGFDRVLIYRFDADLNGTVIAEDRNEELPSYLDLRFPASDIPAQARELYRLNRLRMIPDADYVPSHIEPAVNPRTGRPLDLTFATLRSVSPVHAQYMKNMGTAASMSVSILRDGKLWGLISCHHKLPRHASFEVRSACDIIAQLLS
ncbi:MAG TPA: GAF domain-containing protein, partial [Bryobacteraceae bacterium]|nr:GAF domain-containing protein [Bryobacteraceae bacterium]